MMPAPSTQSDSLEVALAAGIGALGLKIDPGLPSALLAYLRELERWNRRYSLTAVREPAAMVNRHLLDSLAIAPWLHGSRVLDVGSGAGLPGIPLALWAPERRFDLLDASGKKARFLRHVRRTLKIGNVTVIERRLADHRPRDCYDTVVARAFASVTELAAAVGHVIAGGGHLLAMRGRVREPLPARPGWEHAGTHRLAVPGLEAERHLTILVRRHGGAG